MDGIVVSTVEMLIIDLVCFMMSMFTGNCIRLILVLITTIRIKTVSNEDNIDNRVTGETEQGAIGIVVNGSEYTISSWSSNSGRRYSCSIHTNPLGKALIHIVFSSLAMCKIIEEIGFFCLERSTRREKRQR